MAWSALFARRRRGRLGFLALGLLLGRLLAVEPEPPLLTLAGLPEPADYTELSLAELLDMEVTSVSKRPEPLSTAAAAVTVLTRDDIRRSGATRVPDLLRLVPGVQVARLAPGQYAISVRGFNDLYANKVLVLRDGRSLYAPLFSGVIWAVQEPLLEDLERVEVIRGPGGTLWGVNAVNGVINLITRSARDSQGGLLTLGGGLEEEGMLGWRYGGQLAPDTWFKLYGSLHQRNDGVLASGADAHDDLDNGSLGLRLEKEMGGSDLVTLQLDGLRAVGHADLVWPLLDGRLGVRTHERFLNESAALHLGWRRHLGEDEHLRLDFFHSYDHADSRLIGQQLHQSSLDFEQSWRPAEAHRLVWGLGARWLRDEVTDGPVLAVSEPERRWRSLSAFVQDEITLVPERLKLTLGTKVEDHDFVGLTWQPSLRLAWTPHERHTWWAAVSRAVRTPSRLNHDLLMTAAAVPRPPPLSPLPVQVLGHHQVEGETLLAWEAGYRARLTPALTLDTALYYNEYDDLISVEQISPLRFRMCNEGEGETYGGELSATWQVRDWWRLHLGYAYTHAELRQPHSQFSGGLEAIAGQSPGNQALLRASFNLTPSWELDLGLRFVDSLPSLGVPAYLTADIRLGWQPRANLRLDLVARDLGDRQRPEFGPTAVNRWLLGSELEPSFFARLTLTF